MNRPSSDNPDDYRAQPPPTPATPPMMSFRWDGPSPGWFVLALMLFYFYVALLPFEFDLSQVSLQSIQERMGWTAFQDRPPGMLGLRFSLSDVMANFIAGIPLGWFTALALGASRRVIVPLLGAGLVGALTAFVMEILQLFVPGRVSTLTDVVTITSGSLVGAVAARIWGERLGAWVRGPAARWILSQPGRLTLIFLLGFLALRSFFPDQLVTSYGDLKATIVKLHTIPGMIPAWDLRDQWAWWQGKMNPPNGLQHPLRTHVHPVAYGVSLIGHFLLYGLIGGCWYLVRSKRGLAAWLTTVLGVGLLAAMVELAQLMFPSQRADINVVLVAILGGGLGALLAPILASFPRWSWWLCFLVFLAYIATQYLRPAGSPGEWGTFSLSYYALIPFWHYHASAHPVSIFRDVLEGVGLFIPLGWLLAQRFSREGTPWLPVGLICLLLAVPMELLQGFLGRVPSIDDVAWACIGGWIGCWLQRSVVRYLSFTQRSQPQSSPQQGPIPLINDPRIG